MNTAENKKRGWIHVAFVKKKNLRTHKNSVAVAVFIPLSDILSTVTKFNYYKPFKWTRKIQI